MLNWIKLFICIKMDFALITYNGWCAIKPNKTKKAPNECPEFDTKQSDGEVSVTLELWGMRSTLVQMGNTR